VRCRRVSPFRRSDLLAFTHRCILACSEAGVASDFGVPKTRCCLVVLSESLIRPPDVLGSFARTLANLSFS
jgi:hypothetical protein